MTRTGLRRGTPPRRTTRLARSAPLPRRTPLRAGRSLVASRAQRAKVAGRTCVVCKTTTGIDPAHLPRSLGGCDHPDCVAALRRRCHRAYDLGRLDLVAVLEPDHRRDAAHAVEHVGLVGA